MPTTYPGMKVEIGELTVGCSCQLFDGIFATGGITLSQVSVMTGLEPYQIQNWVKRGFVSPPVKRIYSREQFARIVLINMLKEALQIDKICHLVTVLQGKSPDPADDLIGSEELYHCYVDMLACSDIDLRDRRSIKAAAEKACESYIEPEPGYKKQLVRIMQVMLCAHAASMLRESAEAIFCEL